MNDLLQLNRSIAEHWLGKLDARQEDYLSYTPVCLGQLSYSATHLAEALQAARHDHENSLRVLALNRQYLNFARLAAADVAAGNPEMLIRLDISLELVEWLGTLSDEDIGILALNLRSPIVRFASKAFCKGAAMQSAAAIHHATALIATRASVRNR
jgi:hypothetical protein